MTRRLIVADDFVAAAAAQFLARAPRTVALAGGGTPRPVYERLAGAAYDWEHVDVFFGDERCVPYDHPDSNYRMAREALLVRVAARVHPMPADGDAAAYERELAAVFGPGLPRFDLVVLGLGADGHTASLFPGHPAVEVRDRWVVRVEAVDPPRLSLTLPVLSAAATALFLVSGPDKRPALQRLLAGDDGIPAARVAAAEVVIVADAAAVGRDGA